MMVDCKFVGTASLLYGEKSRGRFMVIECQWSKKKKKQPVKKMRVTLVSDQYTRDLTRPERTPRLSHCPTLLSWQSHATLWYSMELLLLCWLRVRLGLLSRVNIRGTHEVVVYDDTWPSCETQNLLCHSQPSISATCCWGNVIL